MKTIQDYLKTLTPKERELHTDLIKECAEREKQLKKYKDASLKGIESLRQFAELYFLQPTHYLH